MNLTMYDPVAEQKEKNYQLFLAVWEELKLCHRQATPAERNARLTELFSQPLTVAGSMNRIGPNWQKDECKLQFETGERCNLELSNGNIEDKNRFSK